MKGIERPENIYLEKYDIHVTPYLTLEQQKKIAELMLETDDLFDRKAILVVGVLAACTDIDDDDVLSEYDTIMASGVYNAVLEINESYIRDVEDMVKNYDSIDYTFTKLCNKISDSINQLANSMPTESKLVELAEQFLATNKEQEDDK